MTLDEKIAQVGSYWIFDLQTHGQMDWAKTGEKLRYGIGQITRLAGASNLDPANAAKTANRLQKFLLEGTRLGIPTIIHEECCSGALMLGGTIYPQMLGLASTFQPELAEAMAAAIRRQLMAIGARQGLAPVLDLGSRENPGAAGQLLRGYSTARRIRDQRREDDAGKGTGFCVPCIREVDQISRSRRLVPA